MRLRGQAWPAFDPPALNSVTSAIRRSRLHHHFVARREHYADEARRRGHVYGETDTVEAVRRRLADRGWEARPRKTGEVHTFAFVPRMGWHVALFPDLYELGPVTEFDYLAHGYTLEEFRRLDSESVRRREEMNLLMLAALREAHARHEVDWVFVYGNGYEVEAATIRQIGRDLGIPTVNMCLDDKQSWTGHQAGKQRLGQIDIAAEFDLSWTSARVACEWYLVEGARPLYLPEGFDIKTCHPVDVERDIPVSFIGAAYGFRPFLIKELKRFGLPIRAFGPGWPDPPVWGDEQVEIFNRSHINLGMGGIGPSEELTNVKTRDFEVPGTGGGLYVTAYNPDLSQHFTIGEEIVCYSNRGELLEVLRWYLAHPQETRAIAERAYRRSVQEHRWLHRYQKVLRVLGILENAS